MSLELKLGGAPLPSTLPILHDAGFGTTPGHLLIIEPGHSRSGLVGVPRGGATVTNLARKEAARLCGLTSADLADLDPTFVLGSDTGATKLKLERTPKGRLHMIVSQSVDTVNTAAYFDFPAAILEYIYDNVANGSGSSLTAIFRYRTTRAQATSGTPAQQLQFAVRTTSPISNNLFEIRQAAQRAGTVTTTGADLAPLNTEVARVLDGADDWATEPDSLAAVTGRIGVGHFVPQYALSGYLGGAPSLVFERFDLIDQTVNAAAGLDPAQVLSDLDADWQAAHASGGRYHGDTLPTDPATLP